MTSFGGGDSSMYSTTMMTERPSYSNMTKKIPTYRKASDSIFFKNKKRSRQTQTAIMSRNLSKEKSYNS